MNYFFKNATELHPENSSELISWSKKWNITVNMLIRAIVDTGSTNTQILKAYIRKNKPMINRQGMRAVASTKQ